MKAWVLGGLLGLAVSNAAYAQTWTSEMRLVKDRSLATCPDDIPPTTFTISGNKLTHATRIGPVEYVIGPNGSVEGTTRSTSGTTLRFTGNVDTREFDLINPGGCQWKLTPKK